MKKKKTSSTKHKSGRKSKLYEKNCWTLHRIIRKDRRTTMLKITSELNEHLQNPVYTKTVCQELHKGTFQGRLPIRNPLFSQTNVSKRLEWCIAHWNKILMKNIVMKLSILYGRQNLQS